MFVRILFTIGFVLVFDLYAYQAIKTLTVDLSVVARRSIRISFWVLSISFYVLGLLAMGGYLVHANRTIYVLVTGIFFAMFVAKMLMMIPMLMEDIYRIGAKLLSFFQTKKEVSGNESFLVSRKKFISQISAGIGGLTFTGLSYGVIKGGTRLQSSPCGCAYLKSSSVI